MEQKMESMGQIGDMASASVIYQAHQDAVSRALLAGDWPTVLQRISLPYQVVALNTSVIANTESEGETFFHTVSNTLNGAGVTDIVRVVREARFKGDDEIVGEHVTHLLRNGTYVLPPYLNRVTLRRMDGVWKETMTSSAFTAENGASVMPKVTETADITDPARLELERNS